ncbi:MAG: hypothetical protein IJG51_07700 [Synergistaceae bacterium]|nr:hypothetical protein [Synergistaceae bacterium]MBQ6113984.1 hypothetical protein [Synergistaceae bacterium]MBQ6419181.1 hypothetical protein [Synergistaceae bacterium]MBQ6666393.1 hypothetical protein [Synergistaceae bacterium]MBQ6982287.1 hypothetical protein [Synergistaceae bacterium]
MPITLGRGSNEEETVYYGGFQGYYHWWILVANVETAQHSPYTWSVINGVLPGGLSIGASDNVEDGQNGNPQSNKGSMLYVKGTSEGGVGTYTFLVKVTDSDGRSARIQQRIKVPKDLSTPASVVPNGAVTLSDDPDPVISGTFLNGKDGEAYSGHVSASAGTAPYTWSVTYGELPKGLSLACSDSETVAGTGTIGRYAHLAGTPEYSSWGGGYYTFTLGVKDAKGNTNAKLFTMKIAESPSQTNNNTDDNGTGNNTNGNTGDNTDNPEGISGSGGGGGGCNSGLAILALTLTALITLRKSRS